MNRVLGLCAVVMICAQGFDASAAEPKGISRSNLSAMGLSNMKVVSDEQGAKVRGMGGVSGGSIALNSFFPILTASHNNYHASGLQSYGTNLSVAGNFFPFFGLAVGGGFSQAGSLP